MKNQLLAVGLLVIASSCSALKRGSSSAQPSRQRETARPADSDPRFLEGISIRSGKSRQSGGNREPAMPEETGTALPPASLEIYYPQQFKYAILLDIPVEDMIDRKLISFLDQWYGTPYQLGGNSLSGVDCSAFVQNFMRTIYGIDLPRTSLEQYDQCRRIKKQELREGDLVFFKTQRHRRVSHVGVYLCNNKFAHASTSSGVMISDLDDPYFARTYVGAGRAAEGPYKSSFPATVTAR